MAEDKTEDTATDEEQPKKKSKKMLWIIIGLGVVALGTGGFFAMKGGGEPAPATAANAPAVEEPVGLVAMDTFLVNLNDPAGDRFMKLTLRLTISPESTADKVETDPLLMARLRDRILTVLTAKSFMELVSPLGKENLRHEIQVELDPLIDSGNVQDVLFSEFVVQ